MKTIIFDARMVGPTGHGISKYIEGVIRHLGNDDPLTQKLLELVGARSLDEVEVISLIRPDCPKDSVIRKHAVIELDTSCYSPLSWFSVPKILKQKGADLFFNPTFASYPSLPCPYVQTVHDLNHLHFGGLLHRLYYPLLLKRSVQRASIVFTVSKTVRDELVTWSGIARDLIEVSYNQFAEVVHYDQGTVQKVLALLNLEPKRYFFCVTNAKSHKNVDFLISAYRAYLGEQDALNPAGLIWKSMFEENGKKLNLTVKLPLVITIKPDDLKGDQRHAQILTISGVDEETLGVLYQECAGFYFPSLYEGFGRPPVEAALAGVEYIVVSDIPVHHEAETLSETKFHFAGV